MFRNYFIIATRNLKKNRVFSVINILGLALGITASLLIMLWVKDEYSVDAFHANKNSLFRIYERQYFNGNLQGIIWTQGPLAEELKKKIPEIEMATTYSWTSEQVFRAGDKIIKQAVNTAGPDFFRMFSFPILAGTAESALKNPHSLAISRNMASHFFGSPEASLGKTILFDNRKNFIVTGVFENLPANSTLQFDCLISWDAYLEDNDWAKDWGSNDPLTFIKLRIDADPKMVENKITHFLDNYVEEPHPERRTQLALQPFDAYYLHDRFENAKMAGGRIQYVRIFSFVALFVLLIACINFMNLSTARSARRAKEVGVRKVMGAAQGMLIRQFLSEAMLTVLLSSILAVLLVFLLLPVFNQLTGKQIIMPVKEPLFWMAMPALVLFTGLLSGIYPSLFLSKLIPTKVLKGRFRFNPRSGLIRKGLVVLQFSLSIILIVGMLVINRQVQFIQNTNPGFNRENLVYFPLEGALQKNFYQLKESLLQLPGIISVSNMSETPVSMNYGTDNVKWEGQDPDSKLRFTPVGVGYDFINVMDLHLAAGRDFSPQFATDSLSVLINETAAKAMGSENPVGKELILGGNHARIIGVIRDFHFQSLHAAIRPLFTYLRNNPTEGSILVRVDGRNMNQAIARIEQVYKKINPSYPFQFHFADEQYAGLYKSERIVSSLSGYFAGLAIFISCLGLLGLAMFTVEQRTKEFGIRKALGASAQSLFSLLSRDFLILVVIAFVIASPVAWWAMNNWLNDYAYKITISVWSFALGGLAAMGVALLTVSYQALKAAIANPVTILKTE